MLENLFTAENLLSVGGTFLYLFGELFALFIAISFLVALLHEYRCEELRSACSPAGGSAILVLLLGSVTPFCSCSTIPYVGYSRQRAVLGGYIIPHDLSHPEPGHHRATAGVHFGTFLRIIHNPLITFVFAICVGLLLDKLGFSRYVKNVNVSGGCGCEDITWEKLEGTFWQKQWRACKYAVKDAIGLFKGVIGWLLLGAGIGAFIYGFVPTELLENFAGADNLWAIPLAAVIGIPMYIRVETMIPIAGILMDKGVSAGIVIALILGGAGASIPEVSLLNSIFKKQMVVTFVLCIFLVAVGTGFAFTLFSL